MMQWFFLLYDAVGGWGRGVVCVCVYVFILTLLLH